MPTTTYPESLPVELRDAAAPVSALRHAGLDLPSEVLVADPSMTGANRRLMLASSITRFFALLAAAVGAVMLTR